MKVATEKYDVQSEGWSTRAYADSASYLAHRAAMVLQIGPELREGDTLLDLACGDGGIADFFPQWLTYTGVDASEPMVAAARAADHHVVHGDLNEYVPPEPVAATTCFRAVYYARDRRAFFALARSYTERKLVFDLNPRQFRLDDVAADLRGAGFEHLELRPFFVPQRIRLPGPLAAGLRALEGTGPLARLLLRFRFTYVFAAS
ncbi:MAG: class I SAM-dependent methyltransferase [Actinobacteria bacterium]|nr:MAG: class I SAM-dependent methyltransferase [Actinomycetota bacterium]